MHVAVTGSGGLIGSQLVRLLRERDHRTSRLVRRDPAAADEIRWDPDGGALDPAALQGVDAVVHLAGEPIDSRRWNDEHKRRIQASRAEGTRLVAQAVAGADDGPRILVCASGIHYYGDAGDTVLTEDAGPGGGFMAEVCKAWEAAADPARAAGVRVVHLRTGLVLDPRGGALAKMLPFARFGLLGRLGSGRQYWSWVSRDDAAGAYHHALTDDGLAGPVNVTAPNPATQIEFARALARVLRRPVFPIPAPRFGPRLLYGEIAETLAFTSMRVLPERLEASGYRFVHPTLEPALRAALDRPEPS